MRNLRFFPFNSIEWFAMFRSVDTPVSFPQLEEKILEFWRDRGIYEKSLEMRKDSPSFVFFEGPPTANGMPHPGHCLTRAMKDLYPRYKTMRGYRVDRKAGWDTHGLPVEVEVCKELGIHSKEEIEEYGIERFIHLCQESVFRYVKEWEKLTERIGFWIHLDEAYVTYHQSYVESVWWILKTLFDRGLLYQGHKIVWWWAQGGTALSAGEVGQGYRETADPSVFVRFPILAGPGDLNENADLLVWTTTPWTLPSNQFAAVKPSLEYSLVEVVDKDGNVEDRRLWLASALVEKIAKMAKKTFNVVRTCPGEELVGLRYIPPFGGYYNRNGEGDREGTLKDGGSQHVAWRVVPAEFVTTDSGTGLVHQAPAFGEIDYDVLIEQQDRFVDREGPQLICAVAPDGKFYDEAHCEGLEGDEAEEYRVVPEFVRGIWVKDADKPLSKDMRARGILFHLDQYLHDYPFCWRASDDPLIQYPRKSWFIRTTQLKDRMIANNQEINWLPESIKDGRFGNFLESNVDWSLSRERYWGTPLPIWVCEETGHMEVVGRYEELLTKPGLEGTEVWDAAKAVKPDLCEDLKIHKPYIDAVTYDSPKVKGARMRRVPEVIDCWFDAGSMPLAQWGYPHQEGSHERVADQFPADFISEALDQTRGWFYSLLAISTLLFGDRDAEENDADSTSPFANEERPAIEFPHPFRNCIVLGLMLAEWWESPDGAQRFLSETEAKEACGKKIVRKVGKMSKSLRNYRAPSEILDAYGADALRWYFYANQAPWNSILYSEQSIKESMPEFLLRLWNVYGFFVIYANIDGFDPASQLTGDLGQLTPDVLAQAETYRPIEQRNELDRWILGELHATCQATVAGMDAYDNYGACGRINSFVDALSNWYVRRSRDRFWSGEETTDKQDAYWTLYECLLTTARLIAPFTPFLAEELWQNLAVDTFGKKVADSVHLCEYPEGDAELIDATLSERMALVREVVSLGRSARMNAKLKVRQPLSRVEIILADDTQGEWLKTQAELIQQELNVKAIELVADAEQYITYTVLPDLKRLGPKLGRKLPMLKKALAEADGAALLAELEEQGAVTLTLDDEPVSLDADDIQVRLQAKEDWAAAQGPQSVVVLATELTPELVAEGYARELIHMIQDRRKELNCDYTDRILVGAQVESEDLKTAIKTHADYIQGETLADTLAFSPVDSAEGVELKLAGESIVLYVGVKQ
jgi:isoleucyl-tRNA synthetase